MTGLLRTDLVGTSQVERVQVRVSHVRTGQVRTCQVGTGQVNLGQVNSSQYWSSLVKTGHVNLDQFKVKLGQVKSSYDKLSQVEICLARQVYIFNIKYFWTQNFSGTKTFF